MAAEAGSSRTIQLDPLAGGYSFARLLFALLRQRFTGTVTLHQASPAGERRVWLRGGMPVFTDWNRMEDALGNVMLERGDIDAGTLEVGLVSIHNNESLLGEVLLEGDFIDEATRTEALRVQCIRKLTAMFAADAFSPAEAEVEAVEHDLGKGDELAPVNVLALVWAGVQAHYDEDRLRRELGDAIGGDLVATKALVRYERQFGFSAPDGPALAALGRGVTLEGMIRPGVDTTRVLQLIFTLITCQMLRVGDDAIQAIASGSTAVAAGHELGVNLGSQSTGKAPAKAKASAKPPAKPKAKPKASAKPPPAPKAKPKASAKPPPAPKAKAKAKPKPKAAAKPKAPSPEDQKFEADLAALEAKVAREVHAFELFGLELDAGRKDIRKVWAELSKTFHPDALEGLGRAHLRPRVEPVFAALSEAYGVLGNKDSRAKLLETLEVGGTGKVGEDTNSIVRNAFEAEVKARDADKLLRGKKYVAARDLFAEAHGLSPQDSDIEAAFYYTNFLAGDRDVDAQTTITKLQKVIEVAPVCARAHYFKGMLHVRLDQYGPAKMCFSKTQELDPRNIDAQRQLRAIKIKDREAKAKAKEEAKGGFLGSLFGKK